MEKNKTITMSVRVSIGTCEIIRYVAKATGKTQSEIIQDAVLQRYKHLISPKLARKGEIRL